MRREGGRPGRGKVTAFYLRRARRRDTPIRESHEWPIKLGLAARTRRDENREIARKGEGGGVFTAAMQAL